MLLLRRFSECNGTVGRVGRHWQCRYQFTLPSLSSSQEGCEPQVVCRSMRECYTRARHLLERFVSTPSLHHPRCTAPTGDDDGGSPKMDGVSGVRSLLELSDIATRFLHVVRNTIALPCDVVSDTDDFSVFLLRSFRRSEMSSRRADDELQLSDEAIVTGFMEWMRSSLVSIGEFVSFVEVLQMVGSYVRYHRGVRWGGNSSKEEWYRSGYKLHPWHDTYCPASQAEQMPYVHLFQWLLRLKPSNRKDTGVQQDLVSGSSSMSPTSNDDEAFRAWCATEEFSPPSWHMGGKSPAAGFEALDCGCHSGYLMDLLLKAGAREIIGTDVSSQLLGSSEATFREHLRERRSLSSVQRTVQFVRCDVLPEPSVVAGQDCVSLGGSKGSVMTSAAESRRRAARQRRLPSDPGDTGTENGAKGPFDLLVFHPPAPTLLPFWPLSHLNDLVEQCALDTGRRHPHCRLAALHELLQSLLTYSSDNASGGMQHMRPHVKGQRLRTGGFVKDHGYVAFILPRTFDSRLLLEHVSQSPAPSGRVVDDSGVSSPMTYLSDTVISTLEGSYELVLKRRHSLASLWNPSGITHRSALSLLRTFVHPNYHSRVQQEMKDFYCAHQVIDLIVMRKLPRDAGSQANAGGRCIAPPVLVEEEPLAYEESFEYTEYLPADGPPVTHHWTEMSPSYSYLEEDFFGDAKGTTAPGGSYSQNFLAVGHPVSPAAHWRPTAGMQGDSRGEASQESLRNTRNLFAKEMKKKRSGRLRKMALSPLEKQEWYIDEKLIKSEAAKIDLLNELSRFNIEDLD
uniref:Methyltransferase domain-containing protein n=1 Tax=Trypanosoma congolense (strain IL3000) TaxID=1068625 RepID=G0UVP6_TRYCI|nr:conserved hypothetical protein [Trypanosoma congolense IL3000]